MIAAHDAALDQRPEAIDCSSMNRAGDILAIGVVDRAVVEIFVQRIVSGVFVGRNEADFIGDGFADEAVERRGIGAGDDASNDITFALDDASDHLLAGAAGSRSALVPMPVLVLAADIGFVSFDNAHELAEFGIGEPGADTVAHIMCGRIATETEHTVDLERRNALLAGQHEVDDLEPYLETDIRVFEDRADQYGETIAGRAALPALPMKQAGAQFCNLLVPTTGATNAFGPAASDKILFASIIGREQFLELRDRHLLRELDSAHWSSSHA